MSNYIEFKDTIAFHPGYYIKEIIDDSGLTQADFAKRLDTTPKNLSLLIRGEQSLSVDMAMKLSRMIGTTSTYWLNLQSAYDSLIAEYNSEKELEEEKKIFQNLDYKYFRDNFKLPSLPRKANEQIKALREFLNIATLNVLTKKDLAVSFRSSTDCLSESNTIKANVMVQIATNLALKKNAPKFSKSKLQKAVDYSLTLTDKHDTFYPLIEEAFLNAGVILVVLPNVPGSKINGATKKLGDNVMLMVNDRRLYSDTFWFTLFHEIGHIMNGDYGISFEKEDGEIEQQADIYARDHLIPKEEYKKFVENGQFYPSDICDFAKKINRDPGIVLGRLQKDSLVAYNDWQLNELKTRYIISC